MPMAGSNTTSQPVGTNNNNNNAGGGPVANNAAAVGANKTWELSDYELHRTPQDALTDGSEIAVSPRALHSELMCPICLDMLHQTMTTKECLHRFCAECIITALRSGNKECPTCRKKLVSKRSLRPDPNFDMLISKIYPSRDEYEAQQQKAMARLSKSHNQLALANSIEEGMKAQSQLRKVQKPGGPGTKTGSGPNLNSSINENQEGGSSNAATGEGHGDSNINRYAAAPVGAGIGSVNNNNNLTPGVHYGGPNHHINSVTTAQHPGVHSLANGPHQQHHGHQMPSGTSSHASGPGQAASGLTPAVAAHGAHNNVAGMAGASSNSHLGIVGPSPAKISRTDSAGGDNSSNTSGFSEEVTEVELVFKPHPDMINSSSSAIATAQNQTRYIKTTANASVEHLTKYLGMRLALDSQPDSANTPMLHNCTIYVSTNGTSFTTIPQNQTLAQVCEKFWRFNKPLEMFFLCKSKKE